MPGLFIIYTIEFSFALKKIKSTTLCPAVSDVGVERARLRASALGVFDAFLRLENRGVFCLAAVDCVNCLIHYLHDDGQCSVFLRARYLIGSLDAATTENRRVDGFSSINNNGLNLQPVHTSFILSCSPTESISTVNSYLADNRRSR